MSRSARSSGPSDAAARAHRVPAALLALALVSAGTLVALAAPATPALAASTLAAEPAFAAAWARFARAADADSDAALDDAVERFTAIVAAAPDDLAAQAYLGAATAMKSRHTLLPWRKMGYAEDGLAWIDKALARLAPAHDAPGHRGTPVRLEVQFVAASTFLGLPEMFHRHERGAQLLAAVTGHPTFASAPLTFRGAVWMRAAQAAHAAGDAARTRAWLLQVVAAGAPQAAAAAQQRREWAL